ncbi:MAG: hypothetical protein EA412_13910 [Chitinophagaceae bacterium]|nr:MAG: hypothetical protein EA412_13910 [Chitinophagaceae bacterium]
MHFKKYFKILVFLLFISFSLSKCNYISRGDEVRFDLADLPLPKLSDYNFFNGKPADHIPNNRVIPYGLKNQLFSDYSEKLRFVYVPEGEKIVYKEEAVFDFPVGTVLIKTFYYPKDFRETSVNRQILETRLLVNHPDGWEAYPYVWNDRMTDAELSWIGGRKEVSWINEYGEKINLDYLIPNRNQCKNCHEKKTKMIPIGPTARNLNKDFMYESGDFNQLTYWNEKDVLADLPDKNLIPVIAKWNDEYSGSLNERARVYLDINCGHCHNPQGSAHNSGLSLDFFEMNPSRLGICKAPIAAGRGSGNRTYSISPGNPENSILLYRMESTQAGIMMPEIGRRMVHTEGVQLIKEWIEDIELSNLCP